MIGIYSGEDKNIRGLHRIQVLPNPCIIGKMSSDVAKTLSQIRIPSKNKCMFVDWESDTNKWSITLNKTKYTLLELGKNIEADFFVTTEKIKTNNVETDIFVGSLVYIADDTIKKIPSHRNIGLWTRTCQPTPGEEIEIAVSSLINTP